MGRFLATTVVLLVFWLGLSGHYTVFLIVIGLLSSVGVVWFLARLEVLDSDAKPYHLLVRAPVYWGWLIKEILMSAIGVAKIVWHPQLPAKTGLRRIKSSQKTPLGQNIFGNSITLTPGTLSVEMGRGDILVHALHESSLDDLDDGNMDRRVTTFEASN